MGMIDKEFVEDILLEYIDDLSMIDLKNNINRSVCFRNVYFDVNLIYYDIIDYGNNIKLNIVCNNDNNVVRNILDKLNNRLKYYGCYFRHTITSCSSFNILIYGVLINKI